VGINPDKPDLEVVTSDRKMPGVVRTDRKMTAAVGSAGPAV